MLLIHPKFSVHANHLHQICHTYCVVHWAQPPVSERIQGSQGCWDLYMLLVFFLCPVSCLLNMIPIWVQRLARLQIVFGSDRIIIAIAHFYNCLNIWTNKSVHMRRANGKPWFKLNHFYYSHLYKINILFQNNKYYVLNLTIKSIKWIKSWNTQKRIRYIIGEHPNLHMYVTNYGTPISSSAMDTEVTLRRCD